jgi:hypothetical protein
MFIEVSNGVVMTHARADNYYGDAAAQRAMAEALVAQHHPGETLVAAVLTSTADVAATAESQGLGPDLSDTFSITQKQNIPDGSTGIPIAGHTMDDLADGDMCLCYTPSASR